MIGTIRDAMYKIDAIAKTAWIVIEVIRESRHTEIQT